MNARQFFVPGNAQIFHCPPRSFVRHADKTYFARRNEFVQCSERLLDRHTVGIDRLVESQPPETIGRPIRPMHLVEVDIVGAQALQRSIDGGVNLLFAQSAAAAKMAADSDPVATADLGRQKYLPAIAARLHPRTNVLLGSAL